MIVCDRCKEPANRQVVLPFPRELSDDALTICETYRDEPIVVKDLCNKCFEEYKENIKKFFERK